tara:strand:+ start:601 stop:1104 length:504 start_codon:yes stop_codon:yes gene_type:complete
MSIRLSVLSLMPMLMLMQACDGTSFGQRLSESFDSQAGEISPAAAQSDSTDGDSALSVTAAKTSEPDKRVDSDKAKASESEAETKTASGEQATAVAANERPDPRPVPERARPYRIIIRLSAADPAAPAEGVTDALRRAGIGFEVETIEKVPVSELNQSPNPQTKPAP